MHPFCPATLQWWGRVCLRPRGGISRSWSVRAEERAQIVCQREPGVVSEVRHVAREIEVHLSRGSGYVRVREHVFGGAEWGYQVIVARADHQPQLRIAVHGCRQVGGVVAGHYDAWALPPVPASVDGPEGNRLVGVVNRDT